MVESLIVVGDIAPGFSDPAANQAKRPKLVLEGQQHTTFVNFATPSY
jgi:hypothetical protein